MTTILWKFVETLHSYSLHIGAGDTSIFGKSGVLNDPDFLEEAFKRHRKIRAWLGKDVLKAYLTMDEELHSIGRRQSTTKCVHAAMDDHGRILAATSGELMMIPDSSTTS